MSSQHSRSSVHSALERRVTGRVAIAATLLTTFVVAVLPLAWDRRYYFHGDTQVAYSGWWYHLGDQVLHGHLPLLNPRAWESGNYIAEGQWGLFSPLIIGVGVALRLAPNVVAVFTLLKVGLILLGALGTYLLLRSYRVSQVAAFAGGVLVGLSGQSVMFDWPSWLTGQMATALLPWAWWLTRRAMRGHNPLPALVACYLVVSIGYVYAALYLAIVILACLVDAAALRDRRAVLRTLGIGAFSALVVITVYLPGIRTAPVTVRSGWNVLSSGPFTVSVGNLFTSMLPTSNGTYLLWCLPLILWIDPRRVSNVVRDVRGVAVGTAIVLAWVLGPDQIGPLRWPARVQPALMVLLVVLLVVLVDRTVRAPSRGRVVASLAWVLAATWVAVSRDWSSRNTTVLGAVVAGVAIVLVAWTLGRRSPRLTTLALGVATVGVFLTQHAVTPGVGALDRHSPARPAGYHTQLSGARGDVLVIGDYEKTSVSRPGLVRDLLVGSNWYRNRAGVQNGYSTIRFRTFVDRFCRRYNGLTCPGMLREVLATEPTTGRPWVDLLSVSTLVMYRPQFPGSVLDRPPAGWSIVDQTRWTVTWVRDRVVPAAGGVVYASPGVVLEKDAVHDRSVRFRVARVPATGGDVVLSRLDWPGYTVSGPASLAAPTAKTLVTVHLKASSTGRTVTLDWSPPGWTSEVVALWLALVGGAAWSVLALVGARRRARRSADDEGSAAAEEDDAAVEPPAGGRREEKADDVR